MLLPSLECKMEDCRKIYFHFHWSTSARSRAFDIKCTHYIKKLKKKFDNQES